MLEIIFLSPKILSAQNIAQQTVIGQTGDPPIQRNTLLLPFSELHKSKIETGILLDAGGIEFADLKKYPRSITNSSVFKAKQA